LLSAGLALFVGTVRGQVIYENTSPYHHIRVIDQQGVRLLSFDGSMETKMSLQNPLTGHFQYTEFFQMPWLWHARMSNVLMVGLGGASTQRAYAHYYPEVTVETVEIDPAVRRVARDYFHFEESPRQRVHLSDGRVFLRRTTNQYDAILMDAYVENRYGSFLPQHLVTKEFFTLASTRLTTHGVLAYNVIGNVRGWRADLLGAVYQTMKTVFPHVYLFVATDSQNVVLIATKTAAGADFNLLQQRAAFLIQSGRVRLPTFRERLYSFREGPPATAARSPVLTDDYAPVDGLLGTAH
jgi:spermidine synthase